MAKTRSQKTPTKSPRGNKQTVSDAVVDSPSKTARVTKKTAAKTAPKAKVVASKKAQPKKEQTKKTPAKALKATKKTVENTSIIPTNAATKAVEELVKFVQRNEEDSKDKNSLFDDDMADAADLYIQITTKKYISSKVNLKPKTIRLTNSIIDRDLVKTCLIVRDLLITTNEQLESIEAANLPTLQQILLLKQLKTEYKPFEKRRQLFAEYDLFLVDDALMNVMPTVLGKTFYGSNKKVPIPVRVTSSTKPSEASPVTIKNQLEKVLDSTSYLPPVGVNVLIKFGDVTLDGDKLQQNLSDVVAAFDKNSLRSVAVKTLESPSLPLYVAEALFDEVDVLDETTAATGKTSTSGLSAFEKGLMELGDESEVAKILGKKLNKK